MYKILRAIFFLLNAEKAHYLAMDLLSIGLKIPGFSALLRNSFKPDKSDTKTTFAGIEFPNRIGLAAGFDKDARWLPLLKELGFGHVEVGTVTPQPQDGNPKPRLFRLKKDHALINRMGFNNQGVEQMVRKLKKRPAGLIVGGNIGKNKITPNDHALQDYVKCFIALYDYVDYIAVNVSSPNTPGLRELQDKEFLTELFLYLKTLRQAKTVKKPIFLKIAPDLTVEVLDELVETAKAAGMDGIIATNTTISRDNLLTSKEIVDQIGAGGLSGEPVKKRSTDIVKYLRASMGADFPIIGVGGVATEVDMQEKLDAGAGLVQVYTGFIYQGPWQVKKWAGV